MEKQEVQCAICEKVKSCDATKYMPICDDCKIPIYKECPKCTVMCQRVGGCDNVQCPNCRSYWCWICGLIESEDNVKDHVNAIHFKLTGCHAIYQSLFTTIERIRYLEEVPSRYHTEQLVEFYIGQYPTNELYFDNNVTVEQKTRWIKNKKDPRVMKYLDKIPTEMFIHFIKDDPGNVKYVKNTGYGDWMELTAIIRGCFPFGEIQVQNEKLCWNAVNTYPHLFEYMNAEFRSYQMCTLAIMGCRRNLDYLTVKEKENIPEDLIRTVATC